ncbi:hypothetical protein [Cognaticolwellia mytili]|uniref:hypothetical protein n=1 Tax=Cognaticolwellia mytili TaxID=1888913 RepID=UPI00117EE505|nr:hypothetical protein [Cognaticolwellia mytili]
MKLIIEKGGSSVAELKKHAFLLSIIALLIIVKFLFLPIITWQDELIAQITQLEKKQNKITQVLANNASNLGLNKALGIELEQVRPLFATFKSVASFKLEQQKLIEKMLAKHKLTLQDIGWQTLTMLPSLSKSRYPLKLTVKGKTIDIINFTAELETYQQFIEISKFNLSLKGQQNNNLGRINGRITLNVFANDVGGSS